MRDINHFLEVRRLGTTAIIVEKGLLEVRSRKSEVRKISEAYNKTILNSGYSKSTSTKMVVEPKIKRWH